MKECLASDWMVCEIINWHPSNIENQCRMIADECSSTVGMKHRVSIFSSWFIVYLHSFHAASYLIRDKTFEITSTF
jgi:hypothetical protein